MGTEGGAPAEPPPEQCPGGGLPPGDHTFTITHAGVEYGYDVHVPPSYDDTQTTPLVLNWHGLGMSSGLERYMSAMDPVSDAHGFIVVYPNSPDASWNVGECSNSDRDDVGFARALVAEMQRQSVHRPTAHLLDGLFERRLHVACAGM